MFSSEGSSTHLIVISHSQLLLATCIQGNQLGSTCYYHVSLLQQFWNGKMQVYLSLKIQVVIQYKLLLANQLNPNPFAIAMPIISTVI
jgi:hypothetical protein